VLPPFLVQPDSRIKPTLGFHFIQDVRRLGLIILRSALEQNKMDFLDSTTNEVIATHSYGEQNYYDKLF